MSFLGFHDAFCEGCPRPYHQGPECQNCGRRPMQGPIVQERADKRTGERKLLCGHCGR